MAWKGSENENNEKLSARSKAQVCNPSIAGIAGSSPADGMDVRLLCWLCVVQVYVCATG